MRFLQSRLLIRDGAKFAVVGLAGAVLVVAGADALHYDAGLGRYASITIATVAGMVPNFLGNRYWAFRHRERRVTGREVVLFFALNCAGMLFQYACIGAAQVIPGRSGRLWYTAANVLGLGLGAAFRFWSYRTWVWRAPQRSALPDGPEIRGSAHPSPAAGRG
jgi:putative flippase GtrA